MKRSITIGVLAFHGDVVEHIQATEQAARKIHTRIVIIPVRTKHDIKNLDGLILPGGESTTLYKLCQREGMWEDMKNISNIFGTCAGAIMLAKTIRHKVEGQQTLERMDITIDRNAYGRQSDSFEETITTTLGPINAIYIRAPKIEKIGKSVTILATHDKEILACEETCGSQYNLASCFHPELTSPLFHEYFLKKIIALR